MTKPEQPIPDLNKAINAAKKDVESWPDWKRSVDPHAASRSTPTAQPVEREALEGALRNFPQDVLKWLYEERTDSWAIRRMKAWWAEAERTLDSLKH